MQKARPIFAALFWGLVLFGGPIYFRQVVTHGTLDLTQFYLAGKVVAAGNIREIHNPQAYEPHIAALERERGRPLRSYESRYFNRPAVFAYFCAPLAYMSYRTALALTVALNFCLLGIVFWKLPEWFPSAMPPELVRLVLATFFPFLWSVAVGQDTLLLTLLAALSVRSVQSGKEFRAGALLAAGAFKPHLIWAIPVAFAAERRWKAVLAYAATGAGLAALTVAVAGVQGVADWYALLKTPFTDYQPASMGTLRAVALRWGITAAAPLWIVVLAGSAIVLRRGSFADRLLVTVLGAMLVSPHAYAQDDSLAAIVALLSPSPTVKVLLLSPWWLLYPRSDSLLLIAISVASIAITAFRTLPAGVFQRVSRTKTVECSSA